MKTVDIKGKKYVEVNERVKEFHKLYNNGRITTQIELNENGVVVFRAIVMPDVENHNRFFTGHAYEKEGSTFINKTSYVENCETSAVGRALGFLNIGIDTSIASGEEVENAIANQTKKQQPKETPKQTEDDFIAEQEQLSKLPDSVQNIIRGMDTCTSLELLKTYVELAPKEDIKEHKAILNKYYNKRKAELA